MPASHPKKHEVPRNVTRRAFVGTGVAVAAAAIVGALPASASRAAPSNPKQEDTA